MPIECSECEGRGEVVFDVGVLGPGDPNTEEVVEECHAGCREGTAVCACCDELAVVVTKRGGLLCISCAAEDLQKASAHLVELATQVVARAAGMVA
jgi:hypothetical protein